MESSATVSPPVCHLYQYAVDEFAYNIAPSNELFRVCSVCNGTTRYYDEPARLTLLRRPGQGCRSASGRRQVRRQLARPRRSQVLLALWH